jgi:hypothetical protein
MDMNYCMSVWCMANCRGICHVSLCFLLMPWMFSVYAGLNANRLACLRYWTIISCQSVVTVRMFHYIPSCSNACCTRFECRYQCVMKLLDLIFEQLCACPNIWAIVWMTLYLFFSPILLLFSHRFLFIVRLIPTVNNIFGNSHNYIFWLVPLRGRFFSQWSISLLWHPEILFSNIIKHFVCSIISASWLLVHISLYMVSLL